MAITEVGSGSQRAQISVLNVTSQGLAFPANVIAGDLLVCMGRCWHSTTPHTSITVTDTRGTTYSVFFVDESTGTDSQFIAYGIATSSGANTVTVAPNSLAETLSFAIDEFAGVDTTTPLSVGGSTSTGASTSASDSLTTLTAGELVVGVMGHTGGAPTITPNNTQIAENENNNTEEAFAAAYQIAGAPGSYSISWTIGSSVSWTASTLSFKETVSSSGTNKPIPTKKRKTRRTNSSDFTGFGAFSALLSASGLFDKDLVTVASASGNTGSIDSLLKADTSSLSGSQPASGSTGDLVSRANTDLSSLTGTQTATGTISSRANTDRSQATGAQTASGTITSRANTDRSQLTGLQSATGTIASRAVNDVSQLTGIQTASGSIASRANADLSSLTGTQPASGAINSILNNDSSIVTGTHGNTVSGTISSIANADLSSLSGTQSASGSIVSRAKDDTSQLTGIQTASGSIVSRLNNDRSALTGSQPSSGTITSLLRDDSSSLFGSQGGAVTGSISSRLNNDLSALVGGLATDTPQSGGSYYYRPRFAPRRVQKTQKIDQNNEIRQEIAENQRLDVENRQKTSDKTSRTLQSAKQSVKTANKRLFDAEQALIAAENEAKAAQMRLIAYLEAQEEEIEEEFMIMQIMAKLL